MFAKSKNIFVRKKRKMFYKIVEQENEQEVDDKKK